MKYNSTLFKYSTQIFVISIANEQSLEFFGNFTKNHVLGYHVWFLIFWKSKNQILHDFCNDPNDEVLDLKINIRLLVKCYDDPIIREWYSINKELGLQTYDLMEWRPESGLDIRDQKDLYERRTNAGGTILRVASIVVLHSFF